MRRLGSIAAALALSVGSLLNSRPTAALEIGLSLTIAPPELPVYEQPEIPGPGYIWTPGYWAWGDGGYYWVPGTWVLPPQEGYLWTPGYWRWDDGSYLWHPGYWSTAIGFYGGVNYGFGYFGHGYEGGYWDHGRFHYNRACNHIGNDTRITNVYNKTVIDQVTFNHVSYNGGRGGVQVRADERELAVERTPHVEALAAQRQQLEVARRNPELRVSANHGHPGIAATPRPGEFAGRGIVAAHGAAPVNAAPVNHAPPEQHNLSNNASHGPGRELTPPQVKPVNGPPRAPVTETQHPQEHQRYPVSQAPQPPLQEPSRVPRQPPPVHAPPLPVARVQEPPHVQPHVQQEAPHIPQPQPQPQLQARTPPPPQHDEAQHRDEQHDRQR